MLFLTDGAGIEYDRACVPGIQRRLQESAPLRFKDMPRRPRRRDTQRTSILAAVAMAAMHCYGIRYGDLNDHYDLTEYYSDFVIAINQLENHVIVGLHVFLMLAYMHCWKL